MEGKGGGETEAEFLCVLSPAPASLDALQRRTCSGVCYSPRCLFISLEPRASSPGLVHTTSWEEEFIFRRFSTRTPMFGCEWSLIPPLPP